MYIEFHDKLGQVTRVDVTRVVAFDMHGNPCALALSYDQQGMHEQILTSCLGQPDFHPMLHNMGINKTVVIKDLALRPLNEMQL
jgi:hypothetical protein